MAEVLRIVDWDKHFESSSSRKLKDLKAVLIPIKFHGDGYTTLIEKEKGMLYYAAWIGIVLQAGKSEPRGTLIRDNGKPHTAATLARMMRMSEEVIQEAIELLVSDEIQWLELIPIDGIEFTESATQVADDPASAAALNNRTEPNRTELKITEPKGKATGIFSRLDLSVLRDSEKLDAWFRLAARSDSVPIKDTIPDQRYVFGCAERAIELGENPAAMFVKLVKARLENISNAQDDRAVARIKTLRGPPAGNLRSTESDADVGVGLTFEDKLERRTRQREKSPGKKP